MFLPELKIEKPELTAIHSQVIQNVVDRLDKAFGAFFFDDAKPVKLPDFLDFGGCTDMRAFVIRRVDLLSWAMN